MNLSNLYIFIGLVLAILVTLVSCSGDKALKLNIDHSIEGLSVTLTGSAIKEDGEILDIFIDWGDGKTTKLLNSNFDSFEKVHLYVEPATYVVSVVTTDTNGESANDSFMVSVDFEEVSLESIKNSMFKTGDNEYLILTVNLHTYQETDQNNKFNIITELIGQMDVDFIAFQECAQKKSSPIVSGIIREDNMALIISDRLKESYDKDYSFVWDWAHYGWNVWEEGVAVLSKHPLIDSDNRYISSNRSTTSIISRKVIYGSYELPKGNIDIFSAHTHWRLSETDNEQDNQMRNIQAMVDEKNLINLPIASFVGGDFNGNPTSDYPWSEGYRTMINNNEYKDTFLEVYPDANNKPAKSIYNTVGGTYPGRIDYIFMKGKPQVKVVDSQIIFTRDVLGKVSDHNGVLTKIIIE